MDFVEKVKYIKKNYSHRDFIRLFRISKESLARVLSGGESPKKFKKEIEKEYEKISKTTIYNDSNNNNVKNYDDELSGCGDKKIPFISDVMCNKYK